MSKEIIRVCAISDTHTLHNQLTEKMLKADVVIHAGDTTNTGTIPEFNAFMHWFSNLDQYQYKICIAGNHELGLQKNFDLYKSLIPDNVIFLHDQEVIIEGLKFYGSARTKAFFNWAFMYHTEDEARVIWNRIPDDVNVLIHHQPIYSIRDYVKRLLPGEIDNHVGCLQLGERVDELNDLLLSITGHLHDKSNFGASKIGNTMFANVAQLNDHYINKNRRPLLFEIDKNTKEVHLLN